MVASNIDLNVSSINDIVMLMCNSGSGPNNMWVKDGTSLDGEASDTLTLMIANTSSGGSYTSTVSNVAGSDSASSQVWRWRTIAVWLLLKSVE